MANIFITGDCHGGIDAQKLGASVFKEGKNLTKNDYVIIAGDFGFPWFDEQHNAYAQERYWLKWIHDKPWTTLFVDGNHENFDKLNAYQQYEWNGGYIHKITDSIYHLMRGYIFTIHDNTFFTFGGGTSIDKNHRIEGLSWWKEEIPNYQQYEQGLTTLDNVGWNVDYVITHTAPSLIHTMIGNHYNQDSLTMYLEEIRMNLTYKTWFCGHYHIDKVFDVYNVHALYNYKYQIV